MCIFCLTLQVYTIPYQYFRKIKKAGTKSLGTHRSRKTSPVVVLLSLGDDPLALSLLALLLQPSGRLLILPLFPQLVLSQQPQLLLQDPHFPLHLLHLEGGGKNFGKGFCGVTFF